MSISTTRIRRFTIVSAAFLLAMVTADVSAARAADPVSPPVNTEGAASILEGPERITPDRGTPGVTNAQNFRPYNLPGEFIDDANNGNIVGEEFFRAYANTNQPIQTSDWWNGAGLQYQGWVDGNNAGNVVLRTKPFVSEPFETQFVDLPNEQTVAGLDEAVNGVRMWNPSTLDVYTGYTDPADVPTMLFGRGSIQGQKSPLVTVGLQGVHPIVDPKTGTVPTAKPWTNVRIQSYTDWGVTMSYAGDEDVVGSGELTMSMANGSPFTWFDRTRGTAQANPFQAWVGVDSDDTDWDLEHLVQPEWRHRCHGHQPFRFPRADESGGGIPGRLCDLRRPGRLVRTARNERAHVVAAQQFRRQSSGRGDAAQHRRQRPGGADRGVAGSGAVRVAAHRQHPAPIPAGRRLEDQRRRERANSFRSVTTLPNSVLRSQMEVTTEDFKSGGAPGTAMQLVFPHHRKTMIAADKANIPQANGAAKYTWKSVNGELQAYIGNNYVREQTANGVLPFMPGVAYEGSNIGPDQLAAEDTYDTLKTWFYQAEPDDGDNTPGPFVRNIGTYFPFQNNTYAPNLAGIYENLNIADQLSRSPYLSDEDTDLKKSKNAVAAEMRDFILASLKEVVGRWADPYTSGVFQYNSDFYTLYGQPEGYGSVQNLNDKHFHWSYFLRAAATIGRYDKAWLESYLPLFTEMIGDVASYDRSSTRYPFLRNFSPFYGHHWANGTANGGLGNDQESTSEAINFSVGMLELGEILGKSEWRDLGMYFYEEEILAVDQYWFNQDADLTKSSGTYWNGNWPDSFVHYQHNGVPFTTPFIGQLFQTYATRSTYFGSAGSPPFATSLLIQAVPLSASHLYLGRNQTWLQQAWAQYGREAALDPRQTAYEVVLAGVQARLPLTGTLANATPDTPGPFGALERIDRRHILYPAATNSMGENFAYALAELGLVDTGVVADTASYGVFCSGGSLPGCVGGTRSYTAYNPTDAPVTVTFRDATTRASVATLQVPPLAEMTREGSGNVVTDTPTPAPADEQRLYLSKPTSYQAGCGDVTSQALPLASTPGSWTLPEGTTPYPTDISALDDSIVCVPARPNTGPTNSPPDPGFVRSWQGTFSGVKDAEDITKFNIFTNQSLFPGWQLNPCVAGGPDVPPGCPTHGLQVFGGNAFSSQVSYDFDSDGTPDRIEQYLMMSLSIGNSWSYENKQTNYKFDQQWPSSPPPMLLGGTDGTKKADFPAFIDPAKPATITVQMWGGTLCSPDPDCIKASFPVPISVNADPVTDRASWIEPPYGPSPEPGSFAPLTPARVLDTRSNQGANGPVPANGVIDVQLTGRGGIPATGVSAVAINVTAVSPSGPGFISAWPSGSAQPTTSILNFTAGQTTPNMVVLPVGHRWKDQAVQRIARNRATPRRRHRLLRRRDTNRTRISRSARPGARPGYQDQPGCHRTGSGERCHRRAVDRQGRRTCHRGLGRRDQRDRRVAVCSRVDQRLAIRQRAAHLLHPQLRCWGDNAQHGGTAGRAGWKSQAVQRITRNRATPRRRHRILHRRDTNRTRFSRSVDPGAGTGHQDQPGCHRTGSRERRHRRPVDRTGRHTRQRSLRRRRERDRRFAVLIRVHQRLAIEQPPAGHAPSSTSPPGRQHPTWWCCRSGRMEKSSCSTDQQGACNCWLTSPATS